jgi:heme-degrading monooxygenase HmoA
MYARITTFSMGPGSREHAERMADALAKTYKSIPGLRSVTFIANWDAAEYGSYQVWDSNEAADAALPAIRKQMEELSAGKIVGTPARRTYEIYEPKL